MSGPKIIPFGQGKAETLAAVTHLAKARCQAVRTALWDLFFDHDKTDEKSVCSFFVPKA